MSDSTLPSAEGQKVILAYSGGLDTSVIVKWLQLKGFEVICAVIDVGQREDFEFLRQKALASGASKFILSDAKEDFVSDYVFPAVAWNARYEGRYYLGTALGRPIIGKRLVEIARAEGTDLIAHGATGKGNDQIRFELTAYSIMPEVRFIAPWRLPEFYEKIKGRAEAIAFAEEHGIPIKATNKKPWSIDENMYHISYESGALEDPAAPAPADLFEWTTDPAEAPSEAEEVEIGFEAGMPVSVNGERLIPVDLLARVNEIGARHGVGRIDIVESRHIGMKSRGVYETPGGTLLEAAHRDMEGLCVDRDSLAIKEMLMPRWSRLVYSGSWHCREMECLNALMRETQRYATGSSTLRVCRGAVMAISRHSDQGLHDLRLSSMDDDAGAFDPRDSSGFIAISALPLRVEARRQSQLEKAGLGRA